MGRALRNGRAPLAIATATAPVRCAIYTRKSTDEGLDRDFNSLDAQRELAEAYITSQRDAGWVVLPDHYDDGGYSGATTNRPALHRLLADIEAGTVNCVVAYRYDRISRSLLDFLQLLEFFKKHGVGFVSISERFDTSTPHGEMALNMVLSVAQCERKVTAQRTKDKIHAARRRGKWTGGMPPLGYNLAPEGGRITVNKDEAEQVPATFEMFVANPSLVAVAQELNRRGWRRKSWTTKTGVRREGKPWNRISLGRLLTNPIYLGMIPLGAEVFRGEHDAIVPKKLYDQVQRLMNENKAAGSAATRNQHGALLRGLLQCTACERAMVHHWTRAHGRLYRYYTCVGAQKSGHAACPTKSVSADKVEQFVVDQIKRVGASPELQEATFTQAVAQLKAQRRGLRMEGKRIQADLAAARPDIERLVGAVSRTTGPATDAIAAELARVQERVAILEAREHEIETEVAILKTQDLDQAVLVRALAAFDPIWEVLLTPERERVLRLLIDRIDYGGSELTIRWRLAGLGDFAAEVNGGAA